MRFVTKILDIEPVTHNVKFFRIEKPAGYQFTPGQATDVSIPVPSLHEQLRPFTFTSLNDQPYLEFTIKRYDDHPGVTDHLHELVAGDTLEIGEPWGAIQYKGPGYFIAGGAGITPFVAILRSLKKEHRLAGNTLFFSNKRANDIIYRRELEDMLGDQTILILTNENNEAFTGGLIDEAFIKTHVTDFSRNFYVCGPDAMVTDINKILQQSGVQADTLVFEK